MVKVDLCQMHMIYDAGKELGYLVQLLRISVRGLILLVML